MTFSSLKWRHVENHSMCLQRCANFFVNSNQLKAFKTQILTTVNTKKTIQYCQAIGSLLCSFYFLFLEILFYSYLFVNYVLFVKQRSFEDIVL